MEKFFKYSFLFFIFAVVSVQFFSGCASANSKEKLIGKISINDWKNSSVWNEYIYQNFSIDSSKLDIIRPLVKQKKFKFILFASIYCDDCLEQVPKIIKILEFLKIPAEKFDFFGLDEYSTEPSGFYKNFPINSTPALFILTNQNTIINCSSSYKWENEIIKGIQQI